MGNGPGRTATTTGLTKDALALLRLARLDMSADQRRQLTNSEVITLLISAWREHRQAAAPQ